MFCFEILSVDQELATSVATVDSRFVSPVTELLAPPIVSFGHFYHLRFFFFPPQSIFQFFFLRISKRNYRKSFLFCNIFIVLRTTTYAKNFNEEYIQKPLIYYRSDQVSCHKNWKYFEKHYYEKPKQLLLFLTYFLLQRWNLIKLCNDE